MQNLYMFFAPSMKWICNIEDARFVSRLGYVYMCEGGHLSPICTFIYAADDESHYIIT